MTSTSPTDGQGSGREGGAVRQSPDTLAALALKHGVDIETLSAAVADYAAFEEQAEAEHRARGGRLPASTMSAKIKF
jgi:hypothetical protein